MHPRLRRLPDAALEDFEAYLAEVRRFEDPRLVLPEARRRGLERALITADADNFASLKIIEKSGVVYAGESLSARSGKRVRRYWVDLSAFPVAP